MKNKIPKEFSFKVLLEAYYDCRKNKRNTLQAIELEFELEKNITKLYEQIKNDEYEIGKSICFICTDPKLREIWAGAFRDRIVHHLVYNAIKDRFTNQFILDTYSCIPNRGTLFGINRVTNFAKKVTRNYSTNAYYLKADIGNYFNSIDKFILFEEIKKLVFEPWLLNLIEKIIFHDPKTNVRIKSPKSLIKKLPPYKSLYNTEQYKGLPIGNLTSQFFSNIYLNKMDQYAKHILKCKYYARYVDDIIILDKDHGFLNHAYYKLDNFIKSELNLWLNNKKKDINKISKGFDFIGCCIKPGHRHLRKRIINKSYKALNDWKKDPKRFDLDNLENYRNKINSYLGMFKHTNDYNTRKKIIDNSLSLFTTTNKNYSKIDIVNYKD